MEQGKFSALVNSSLNAAPNPAAPRLEGVLTRALLCPRTGIKQIDSVMLLIIPNKHLDSQKDQETLKSH